MSKRSGENRLQIPVRSRASVRYGVRHRPGSGSAARRVHFVLCVRGCSFLDKRVCLGIARYERRVAGAVDSKHTPFTVATGTIHPGSTLMQVTLTRQGGQPCALGSTQKPFSSGATRLHTDGIHTRRHQGVQRGNPVLTRCESPVSSGLGRRIVSGAATAALVTWIIQSAQAKSMKPEEVQRRSREEENAIFENREGEVSHTVSCLHLG